MFIASTWYDHRVIAADRRSVVQQAAKARFSANRYRRSVAYLNQMRWYERLSGWRSRPTSAPSNNSVMITGELITSAPDTAMSMTSWRTAAATATGYAHFHSLAIPYPPTASPTIVARPSRRLVEMTPNSSPKTALM